MPSGNVTLLEASRFPDNQLARGVVEVIVQESPILEMLPFITLSGEAYVSRHEKELPSVAFRKVNAGYTKSYGTFEKHNWGVTILGGEVFVDNFIVNTRPADQTKARQFNAVAKAAALTFDRIAIDGDGTSDTFKGLNQMVTEGFGQTQANNGGTPATVTQDDLDECIDLVRVGTPDAILGNRTIRRQITSIGRAGSYSQIDVGNDKFGRQVVMYAGIPYRIIGDDETGTQILAFDEASSTSSLYFTKFGDEENIFGIMGAGGMMDVKDFGEQEASPGHMGRIEFYPGMATLSKYALVRLTGITAS
jgi:hypothetical protein